MILNTRKWDYLLSKWNKIAWGSNDSWVKEMGDEIIEEAEWLVGQAERELEDPFGRTHDMCTACGAHTPLNELWRGSNCLLCPKCKGEFYMKKIAILTDFLQFDMQYGLVPAVLNQLRTLQAQGYDPHLFTVEGTESEKINPTLDLLPEGITIKPFLPAIHLFDYQLGTKEQKYDVGPVGKHATPHSFTNFKKQVKLTEELLEPELQQYDIVIEHDILFQTWKLPYNQALRNIGKRHPQIKWIHWCHSAPSARPHKLEYPHTLRFTPMPNSIWVTMNDAMRSGFALQYDTSIENIKTVYHAIDYPTLRKFHPLSTEIWKKHQLWKPELIVVAVSRFDHARAKGMYNVAEFVRELEKLAKVLLIYVNSWSKAEENKKHIEALRRIIPSAIFTSEHGKKGEYEQGVPHEVVIDMYDLSNIHIMASQSETFSFTMVEAALGKNYLVVNKSLKPLVELMPEEYAKHVPWGSDWGGELITENYAPTKQLFMYDRAKEVYQDYLNNKALRAHRHSIRTFSPEVVWENQYKPLIEGN